MTNVMSFSRGLGGLVFLVLFLSGCSLYSGAEFEAALHCGLTIEEITALAQKHGESFNPPTTDDPIGEIKFESFTKGDTHFFLYFGDQELGMLLASRSGEGYTHEVFCCPEVLECFSTFGT